MKLKDINNKDVSISPKLFGSNFNEDSRSKLQLLTRQKLIERYPHEVIYEDFTIPSSRLSVDFLLYRAKIVIEVDGKQHSQFSAYHHGDRVSDKKYAGQRKNDRLKSYWCKINNFRLIRIESEKDLEYIDE